MKRQLNIELLRIFAMLLILLWHIKGHFMPQNPTEDMAGVSSIMQYAGVLISFHVDLFVLITGFFGIKHPQKAFMRTLSLCVFYALTLNVLQIHRGVNWREILLPLSESPWWFLKVYMLLVLVSPLLEVFTKNATARQFYGILAVAGFVDVYFGFVLHLAPYHNHGYDIFNFIFLYLLGRMLQRSEKAIQGFQSRPWLIALVLLVCCAIRWKVQPFYSEIWYDYNSPLCILMAVCVFCLFKQLHIPEQLGKPIMYLSSSAISVYLITDYHGLRPTIASPLQSGLAALGGNTALQCAYIAAFMVVVYVLCCLFDKLRIFLFNITAKAYKSLHLAK